MIFYDLDECFFARKQKCMSAPKGWRTFLKFDECKGIENKCKFQIICPKNSELPDIPIFRLVTYSFPCRCDTSKTRLFFRSISIAAPSLLHRCSIVSMDYRWSNDGVSWDLKGNYLGGTTALLMSCFLSETFKKRHEKSHTIKEIPWWCGKII